MKKKSASPKETAPKKTAAPPDDELTLQPVEPINDAVVTTHRAPNAREQIINQIHADGALGGGVPDLPADAPEFEAPRRLPLFTPASIVRLVILLAILAGVAVFVFNVYKNVYGRPINPEAPPDRSKTMASITQPPVKDMPIATPAPTPAPVAKRAEPAKSAAPAQSAMAAKSPYLNSGQDELLSAKDMADKEKENPAPPPPPAQQLDINDLIGKPKDTGAPNADGDAANQPAQNPARAPQPSLPPPKPPPPEKPQVIPPAPDLEHPPSSNPAPNANPASSANAAAQKAPEGPVTSAVPTVMPVPPHQKDNLTILTDYPGWFCRDYSEDNSLQQAQSIHRDRSKVIALTPPPKHPAQLAALIEIPQQFENAEMVIDVSTRDIPHTWQLHALANNDEVLPATEVKTTKEKGWNEIHISLARQKGTRFYLALEVLPATGSTFWKENVGFISNMRLNWKK